MKEWLEKNKIYFETIAAALLSVMAIVVGVSQLIITKVQTDIVQQQTEIQKTAQLPRFVIHSYYVMNDETQKAENEIVELRNLGEIARDVTANTAVYLNADIILKDGQQVKFSIPIRGYFYATTPTGNIKGTIYKIEGYENNKNYGRLYHSFYDLISKDERIKFGEIDLRKYLSVRFQTYDGSQKYEYFRINAGEGGELLNIDMALKYLEILRKQLNFTIYQN